MSLNHLLNDSVAVGNRIIKANQQILADEADAATKKFVNALQSAYRSFNDAKAKGVALSRVKGVNPSKIAKINKDLEKAGALIWNSGAFSLLD